MSDRVLAMGFVFFFFQAEDGIRDTSVTGVQTCALPILSPLHAGCAAVPLRDQSRLGDPRRSGAETQLRSAGRVESISHLQRLRHRHWPIPTHPTRLSTHWQI